MELPVADHVAVIFSNAEDDRAAEQSNRWDKPGGVHIGTSQEAPSAAALGQSAAGGAETRMDTVTHLPSRSVWPACHDSDSRTRPMHQSVVDPLPAADRVRLTIPGDRHVARDF